MARIKGVALLGIVKTLRTMRTPAEARLPEAQRRYLVERILVSDWYPEADYRVLLLTLGELLAERVPGDVWEFLGEEGARAQFRDFYTLVVRVGDPAATLRRAGTTWSLYHDTGEVTVNLGDGLARVELRDYATACERVCGTTTGYLRQLLVQSGAQQPHVRMVHCPRPEDGPVVWQVTWDTA